MIILKVRFLNKLMYCAAIKFVVLVLLIGNINFISSAKEVEFQQFFARDTDTVIAFISEKELSRLFFKEGRVKQVFAINGELNYEVIEENIYIKPNVKKPINFFVSTEEGNTYQIIATPKDIPAVQISIVNKSLSYQDTYTNQNIDSGLAGENILRQKISKIIKAVKAEDLSVGYKSTKIGRLLRNGHNQDIHEYFDSIWYSDEVEAEKHLIRNNSAKEIQIDRGSYLNGFDAIYLSHDTIAPGGRAILIKVKRLRVEE